MANIKLCANDEDYAITALRNIRRWADEIRF